MAFNNFHLEILKANLPQGALSDEEVQTQNGLWVEEDMLEFIATGDRLSLYNNQIQVVKYSSEEIPVEICNQEFIVQGRNEFLYPVASLQSAIKHFLHGNI